MSKIAQGQNFIDKCLELTGDLSGLLDIAVLNKVSITDDLPIGYDVKSSAVGNRKVVQFFTENDQPATAVYNFDNSDIDEMLGIGAMVINETFIVR